MVEHDAFETAEERKAQRVAAAERRAFIRRAERLSKRTLAARVYDNRQAVLRLAEMSKHARAENADLRDQLSRATVREETLEDQVSGLRTTLANVRQDLVEANAVALAAEKLLAAERSARRPVTTGIGTVRAEVMGVGFPRRGGYTPRRSPLARDFINWLRRLVRW